MDFEPRFIYRCLFYVQGLIFREIRKKYIDDNDYGGGGGRVISFAMYPLQDLNTMSTHGELAEDDNTTRMDYQVTGKNYTENSTAQVLHIIRKLDTGDPQDVPITVSYLTVSAQFIRIMFTSCCMPISFQVPFFFNEDLYDFIVF